MQHQGVELQELPCGCYIGSREIDGEKEFMVAPCDLNCETYRFIVNESIEQKKPVRFEMMEE